MRVPIHVDTVLQIHEPGIERMAFAPAITRRTRVSVEIGPTLFEGPLRHARIPGVLVERCCGGGDEKSDPVAFGLARCYVCDGSQVQTGCKTDASRVEDLDVESIERAFSPGVGSMVDPPLS